VPQQSVASSLSLILIHYQQLRWDRLLPCLQCSQYSIALLWWSQMLKCQRIQIVDCWYRHHFPSKFNEDDYMPWFLLVPWPHQELELLRNLHCWSWSRDLAPNPRHIGTCSYLVRLLSWCLSKKKHLRLHHSQEVLVTWLLWKMYLKFSR